MNLSINRFLILLLLILTTFAHAGDRETYLTELEKRMFKVEEFEAIREWGKTHGVRIWCAGGTATGLGVYVKHELENEARAKAGKKPKYFEGRFSYNYFDIFRSTQDADIVMDGNEAQAQELELYLQSKYKGLGGSKALWEVRLLNQSRGSGEGEKDPLLEFNFQKQHSDSFSTGMIELTDPQKEESRVRDLFDWKNQKNSPYLNDLLEGKVTFYHSAEHFKTKRAAGGNNPEILSAIRAITKAIQYESEIRNESEIKKIIHDFKPTHSESLYVIDQITKNAMKLFWHSPDVERAWNEIERLGLRKKLIEFAQAHGKSDLEILMNREPLRSFSVGMGNGKTAAELGISIVAHETNSFLAYENISRSLFGKANVFISRTGYSEEAAAYGDGFYTRIGKIGARGTGLTIRFTIDPHSREGVDFSTFNNFVVIKNANAIRVIDETLNISTIEFLRLLASNNQDFADRGLFQKLLLKRQSSAEKLAPEEVEEAIGLVKAALKKSNDVIPEIALVWFGLSESKNHPEIFEQALKVNASSFAQKILSPMYKKENFEKWVDRMIAVEPYGFITLVKTTPGISDHPRYIEWIDQVILHTKADEVLFQILMTSTEVYSSVPKWIMLPFFERGLLHAPAFALDAMLSNAGVVSILYNPNLNKMPWLDDWLHFAKKTAPLEFESYLERRPARKNVIEKRLASACSKFMLKKSL